jgi:DNA (cytosine-5)-methyltransferase 1
MNSSQGELLPIQSHPRFRLISLFAGAGGFTLGFTKEFNHNFELVWANDINQHTVSTFNANFAQPCVLGDLRDLLKDSNIEIPTAGFAIY